MTGWLKGKEENVGYVRYLKGVGKVGEAVVRDIRLLNDVDGYTS